MLSHPWLKLPANHDIKMSEEEFQEYLLKQQELQEIMDPPMLGEEMCKLEENESDINAAG